jgi:integrase
MTEFDGSEAVRTSHSRRLVALPKITVERLRLAKREQAKRRLQIGIAWHDLNLVCDSGDGSPFHPDTFGKATKRLMSEARFDPKTRLHDCRHAVATIMLQQGVHPAVASAMLGHSSVAFTMDTYQHVNDQMADQAAGAIDDAFAAGVSGPK